MLFPNFVFGTHLKGIISTLCARDMQALHLRDNGDVRARGWLLVHSLAACRVVTRSRELAHRLGFSDHLFSEICL